MMEGIREKLLNSDSYKVVLENESPRRTNPKLVEGGRLKTYDRVLANFPFSMDWDNKFATHMVGGEFVR